MKSSYQEAAAWHCQDNYQKYEEFAVTSDP